MADVFSKEKRSEIMSRIKGRDTKPEIIVATLLRKMKYRYRTHAADLPGKPDIVLPRHNKAIFVHGCFWHGHKGCPRAKRPRTNVQFWNKKISANVARDQRTARRLRSRGWSVWTIWQCQTKDVAELERRLKRILSN